MMMSNMAHAVNSSSETNMTLDRSANSHFVLAQFRTPLGHFYVTNNGKLRKAEWRGKVLEELVGGRRAGEGREERRDTNNH